LTVFAAASLSDAFKEAGAAFQGGQPGTSITFNFAGSQQLRTQLEQGARADLFASADQRQVDAVVAAGLAQGKPVTFATNRLVVIAPVSENKPGSAVTALKDLAQPGVRLVLALPSVPAGNYTRTALEKMRDSSSFGPGYYQGVMANVVSEETNVRGVAQKVALGEADAGIVYQTDAAAPSIRERVRTVPIPDAFNVRASYPVVALKGASQPQLAQEFIQFILSTEGQGILERHGFGPGSASGAKVLPETGGK
jgi:molybdate transport system substrate-binding protein